MRVERSNARDEGALACSTTNTRPLQGCPAVHHVMPEGTKSRCSVSGASRNNNISAHLGNNRLCVAPHFVSDSGAARHAPLLISARPCVFLFF